MEAIRNAIEAASGKLAEHPEMAVGTDAAAVAGHEEGLRFRVDGPNGAITTDMSESVGGGASAPDAGARSFAATSSGSKTSWETNPFCSASWGWIRSGTASWNSTRSQPLGPAPKLPLANSQLQKRPPLHSP